MKVLAYEEYFVHNEFLGVNHCKRKHWKMLRLQPLYPFSSIKTTEQSV